MKLKGLLVLVVALMLAGTFLWAELRLDRPVAPARVAVAPAAEDLDEAVFWDEDDLAFNAAGGAPRPAGMVAKFLGLSEGQVEFDLVLYIDAVVAANKGRRENNQAIREAISSGDAVAIGSRVLANHKIGQSLAIDRQTFVGSLDEDQKRKLGAVRLASRLQRVLPAFRVLGLLPHR